MIKIRLALLFFIYTSVSAAVIPVGPKQAVKDLKSIKDGNEYVIDYGTYAMPNISIKKSLVLRSSNPNARATLQFQSAWGKLPSGGPDLGSPKSAGSIICSGNCVFKDLKTSGGEGVIVFNTQPGSTLLVQHVDMDGGGILRGSGGKDVKILQVQSMGRPTAYFIANFNNRLQSAVLDFTGTTLPVQQGGRCSNGKPTCDNTKAMGEAAIRFMQSDHVIIKGLVSKDWLFDGKHEWKQFLQLRDSNLIEIFNSHISLCDIGDMIWRRPALPTKEVRFTDCVLDKPVHKVDGWRKIVYKNTKVAGKVLNKTEVK